MDSISGKTFETINPTTGTVLATVSEGDKVHVFCYTENKNKIINLKIV